MSCSCCFTGWFLAGQQSTNGKNKSSENNQSANSQIRFATLLSQKLDSFFDVELEATALCRPKMNDLMGSLRRTLDRCDAFVIAHNHGIAAFEQEACRIEAACRSIPCSRFVNENRNRLLPFVSFRRLNQAASRHAKVLLRRRVKVTETAMRNRLKTTVRHDLPPDLEDDPSAANINRSSRMPSAEGGARQRRTEISSRRNLHTRQKNTEPSYVGGVGDVGDAGGADEHEPGTGITGEDAVADNLSVDSEMADLRQVLHQQLDQEPLLPESSPVYLSIVVEATKGLSVQHRRENSRVSGLLDALDTHDRSDGISSNGFRVFSAMSNVLGTFEVGKSGELRSEFQAELHRCLLRSCIPLIHSRDWAFNSLQICKNYNVDHNILMYTYIVWGRRCGKSLGVCMFYAAMALYMEGPFIVAFVSTGLPAVLELLRVIFSFIQSKIESTGRVARFSSSGSRPQIIITTPGQRKEEGITFVGLPKGTANNRGGRNLSHICVDEGAYVDPNVWAKVIIPAMRLQGVSGVFLSSMDTDTQNPFNRLGELKDAKGNPVFNTVRMELVCPECKARKIMDCPHYRYRRPGWLVTSAQEELIHAMSKIMNPTSYYTELYGVTEPDRLYCFKPETINLLFESKGVGLQTTSVIYTMIDYGGGGVGSDTSIVSMMTTGSQKVVILGYESFTTLAMDTQDEVKLFKRHFACLRKNPALTNARIVVFQEGNMCWSKCTDVFNKLTDVPLLLFARSVTEQPAPGVWTTETQKEVGVRMLADLMTGNWISFADTFFTHTALSDDTSRGFMCNQLRMYEQILSSTRGSIENKKYRYSGKKSGKDDVATSLLLGVYWMLKFESEDSISDLLPSFRPRKVHPLAMVNSMLPSLDQQYLGIVYSENKTTKYYK